MGRFIELAAGLTPAEALVSAVFRETEGNPFFVNEVVRLLVTDGRLEHPEDVHSWTVAIPQGVREVIGRRLDHLSAECNRVLTTAAVVGREFGLDALERLTDLSADRLLELLEEAVAARVVAEVPRAVGYYAFSHALIRETRGPGDAAQARRAAAPRGDGDPRARRAAAPAPGGRGGPDALPRLAEPHGRGGGDRLRGPGR